MAVLPTRSETERFDIADKALADYQNLLTRWGKDPEAQADYQRARIDRLGALLVRHQTADLIKEYEAMEAEGYKMPDYARRWAASAYIDRGAGKKQRLSSPASIIQTVKPSVTATICLMPMIFTIH